MSDNNPIKVNVVDGSNSAVEVDVEAAESPTADAAPAAEIVPNPPSEIVEKAKADSRDGDDAILTPDNPLRLKNPILINGKIRNELEWTLDITAKQFLDADVRAHQKRPIVTITETDNGFQFELGVSMICAADRDIDPKDLDQIKGRDIMRVMKLGRFFTADSDD